MATIFKTAFAETGDKITVPGSVQVDGSISIPQGWGPDYERARELSPGVPDPDYKPVGREEMNGILFMATQAIGEMQLRGAALWASAGAPYPINAVVYHNNAAWLSTAASNSTEPGTPGATWVNAYQRRFLSAGEPLPTTNVGPIWHDDYNSLMTWQSFTANGAAYTGYASQFVGRVEMDTQPTARPGYVLCGSQSLALSRTQYAALRAWGLHNGRFVASGVWQAGTLLMADNPDGVTFRAFDVRGEFPAFWDNGRGGTVAAAFGAWQASQNKAHNHVAGSRVEAGNATVVYGSATVGSGDSLDHIGDNSTTSPLTSTEGGTEGYPRHVAFSAQLKF